MDRSTPLHTSSQIYSVSTMRKGAALRMLLGTSMVFALLLGLNKPVKKKNNASFQKQVSFAARPKKKPPKKRRRVRRKKRIQPKRSNPKVARPQLSASLSGIQFGLPSLDIGLDSASNDLLGKTQNVNDLIMTNKTVDVAASPRRKVSPIYPPRASAQRISGYVQLRILVGTQGDVQDVEVQDAQPSGVFDQAATSAVQKWTFTPAMYKGQPVKQYLSFTMRFHLPE